MSNFVSGLKKFNMAVGISAILMLILALVFIPSHHRAHASEPQATNNQTPAPEEAKSPLTGSAGLAFIAAALATGLGSIGAGIAVSAVGAAAVGAIAEKPELMGKALIYVALAEGIAIYGLLISIIILAKV